MPNKFKGRTASHAWLVTIVARSPTSVTIRVHSGPGKSRGKLFRMKARAFARLYQEVSGD